MGTENIEENCWIVFRMFPKMLLFWTFKRPKRHPSTATTIIQYPPPQPPSPTSHPINPTTITICHELVWKVPKKQLMWYLSWILPKWISKCSVIYYETSLEKSKTSVGKICTANVKTLFNARPRIRYFYWDSRLNLNKNSFLPVGVSEGSIMREARGCRLIRNYGRRVTGS